MVDIDPVRMAKIRALESIDSIYTGCHWSIYPLPQYINRQSYHIAFIWGKYFEVFLDKEIVRKKFIIGYLPDYLINKKIRDNKNRTFTVTYFDNLSANDLLASDHNNYMILELLVNLVKKYKSFILNVKLKRLYDIGYIDYIINMEKKYPKQIHVFPKGKNCKTYMPSKISRESDLAIGINFSTAIGETVFSGVTSFYANFPKIQNDFLSKNLGKFVFSSLEDLEGAITDQMNNKGVKYNSIKKAHLEIDPFQDGKAAKRVSNILDNTHKLFTSGNTSKQVLDRISDC